MQQEDEPEANEAAGGQLMMRARRSTLADIGKGQDPVHSGARAKADADRRRTSW